MEYYKLLTEYNTEIDYWIDHNLRNYLKVNPENQGEIEHIIDYLKSDQAPKRLKKMSYKEAAKSAEKWVKSLAKKGKDIIEVEGIDYEVVFNLKDEMKLVKLLSEKSFKAEGFKMAHCVSSYFGNENIYSLRDKNNNPHCTFELKGDSISQCKGKGNGCIHPKYVDYVLEILNKMKIKINPREMTYLGYFNPETYNSSKKVCNWYAEKVGKHLPKFKHDGKVYYYTGSK